MSLTNPDKIVTEERLNEYHNTILPYLGGMPDILANKFSRGDMYSTDEKMIGQWIDGKPVYQKTFGPKSITGSNNRTWHTIEDLSSYNVDQVVSAEGFYIDSVGVTKLLNAPDSSESGIMIGFNYPSGSKNLNVVVYGEGNESAQICITAKYTKTTDSPVAIGIDTDYSTEEKIVGTWIDGKPLYQKTIVINNPANASSYLICSNGQMKAGFSTISFMDNGTLLERAPYFMSASDFFQALFDGDHVFIRTSLTNLSTLMATGLYIKTTD